MKLEISNRPCHISNAMATNTERHGEEDVGAIDLPIDGIMLNRADLDALLGDGAHAALYVTPPYAVGEEPAPQPRFPCFKPVRLDESFENASVLLTLGWGQTDEAIELSGAKVRSIELDLQSGGLTMLSCKIRGKPDAGEVAMLFEYLNHDASIEIRSADLVKKKGKAAQGNLAFSDPDDGGEDDGEEAGPASESAAAL